MTFRASHLARIGAAAVLVLGVAQRAHAQLDEHCTVSVLNRTVQVNPDGSWQLPNIPANFGRVKARATCVRDGVTTFGESGFFTVPQNGNITLPNIVLGPVHAIPGSIAIAPASPTLTEAGQTIQLEVTATYPDGSTTDVTEGGSGTNYTISNPAIATIDEDGLVTAVASGTVLVQATNDGTPGLIALAVTLSTSDTDGDGIPDDVEVRNGLDPNNPLDALEDPDRDGLTNAQEIGLGTDPHKADTDGDGLRDGDELAIGTSPVLRDTDGDGVGDALERELGTDPRDPGSVDLAGALTSLTVAPAHFALNLNTIDGDVFQTLTVTGIMRDGGSIDLTSGARGTTYASSDLTICNFGESDGQVFAGSAGACTITVTNAGSSAVAIGTVRTFTPAALSSVNIPGFANSVDVNSAFAYVAAGSTGLQIVDVSDRAAPRVVASLDTPGNANDVKVAGTRAYIADGSGGLAIVDISDPLAPRLLGAVATPGADARDVRVTRNLAFVADGAAGLAIIDVTSANAPVLVGTAAIDDGVAIGVDVEGNTAVIAASWAGLRVVDVTDPTTPVVVGVAYTQDAQDVVMRGTLAYVADLWGGAVIVDVSVPGEPVWVGSAPYFSSGVLTDVAVAESMLFGADIIRGNRVPVVDVSVPENPSLRQLVDFSGLGGGGLGTGIAVDHTFIYLTAASAGGDGGPQTDLVGNAVEDSENGVTGETRLYIGQYRGTEDTAGIPPTVTISSPAAGTAIVEGETIAVTVAATDDVAVSAVTLLVDGVEVGTDTTAPYEFTVTSPVGTTSMRLSATAIDLAGNPGTSADVQVILTPDPLTTVTGRVVDKTNHPVAGVDIFVNGQTGTTAADGTFSIGGVRTARRNLVVTATLVQGGTIVSSGSSLATPAERGGTTNVGDIVVAAASYERNLGARQPGCDDCDLTLNLPFDFPGDLGVSRQAFISRINGYVSLDNGGIFNLFCCNLRANPADSSSGVYVNDQLPGRVVVTWFRMLIDDKTTPSTVQVILFDDGRIQYGYPEMADGLYAQVAAYLPTTQYPYFFDVDFSTSANLVMRPIDGFSENFSPDDHAFDLTGGFVIFEPRRPDGGYLIHSVSDAPGPTCSVTTPPNGATLFGGERITVEATASSPLAITRVILQSSDGSLDTDSWTLAPFSAPFTVPAGASQLTFNVTAYDAWNHAGVCTATVSVIVGPPPTVTVVSPSAGTVLIAGSTVPIAVQATSRLDVSRIDGSVNGVPFFSHAIESWQAGTPGEPQLAEFLFTVPAGVPSVTVGGSAVDSVGTIGSSAPVTFAVAADPLTTLQGRVVDQTDAPVDGARVTAELHGVTAEVFNFGAPVTEMPDLTGKVPDRVTVIPTLNMRNPAQMFGSDPFGFGSSPGRAMRFTARFQPDYYCYCKFTLGVNQRGLLRINGYLVLDATEGSGYREAQSFTIVINGTASLELVTFGTSDLEAQLSMEHDGSGMPGHLIPSSAFVPVLNPYRATTGSAGTFAIANLPTTLGDIGATAMLIPATGSRSSGRAVPVAPVAGGATDVGSIRLTASPDIYTIDADKSAIVRLDTITETSEVIAVNERLAAGKALEVLRSGLIAVGSYATFYDEASIMLVDPRLPADRNQTVVSSGRYLMYPWNIAEEANGNLIVVGQTGELVRIDPSRPSPDNQTLLSPELWGLSVMIEPNGAIVVGDRTGQLVRLDPVTLAQTPVPNSFGWPYPAILEADGSFVFGTASFDSPRQLVRLSPDGTRSTLTEGEPLRNPVGMTLEATGNILVMDDVNGLLRVDRQSGEQTVIYPRALLASPWSVVVAPPR